MNKYGEVIFFERPQDDNDPIYCPFCGADYHCDARFECGLTITSQTPVMEFGNQVGFDCIIASTCKIKVAEMEPKQLKAHVKYLIKQAEGKFAHA